MGHDDVDPQLGDPVEVAAHPREPAPAGDERVEVGHLGLHGAGDQVRARVLLAVGRGAAHRQAQVALRASRRGHEQALLDPPRDHAAVALGLVLGLVEGEQHERPPEHRDLAAVLAVEDPEDPQRDPREEPPVGGRQALEVLGAPDAVELRAGERDLGLLLGAHAAVGRRLRLGHVEDLHAGAGLTPATDDPPRVALSHRVSLSRRASQPARARRPPPCRRRPGSGPARPPPASR